MDPFLILQVDWPLADVWSSTIGFITIMVLAVGSLGLLSKRLTVAIWGSYMTFVYYAVETDIEVLNATLFVTVTLVILGAIFKLWRSEVVGESV